MSKSETGRAWTFDGDFDMLPLRAHILFGEVPTHPTAGDFALAVSDVESHEEDVAAHWRVEAIRERRLNPGVAFSDEVLRSINTRVAARLYRVAVEGM